MTALPSTGWMRTAGDGHEHVVPLGDLRVHDLTPDCWCEPTQPNADETELWAHNSLDRREEHERGASLN